MHLAAAAAFVPTSKQGEMDMPVGRCVYMYTQTTSSGLSLCSGKFYFQTWLLLLAAHSAWIFSLSFPNLPVPPAALLAS